MRSINVCEIPTVDVIESSPITDEPFNQDRGFFSCDVGMIVCSKRGSKGRTWGQESWLLPMKAPEATAILAPYTLVWISQVAALIAIMMADPRHGEGEAILIAAFGNKVEIIVRAETRFCAPGIGGIRVEMFPTLSL